MLNPWRPADSNPLGRLQHLLRVQMPGAPEADISAAIEDLLALAKGGIGTAVAAPASDEVLTRLSTVEAAVEKLRADIAALPAAAPTSADEPTVTQRLDAIDRTCIALQGSISKLEAASPAQVAPADTTDAIHRRLAALEARPAAPARAAAPAARPAAASA